MLVSINWLRDYADVDVPVEEFCDRMILSGSNIETVEAYGTKFSEIVVGRILKIEKHPDADRLVVCSVDVGEEEPVQIVTGAKMSLKEQPFPSSAAADIWQTAL